MYNLLIVSKRFPPTNHIASRRFGYMVQFMEEFGWKPWILTQPGDGDLPVAIPEAQIVRIPGGAESRRRTAQPSALAGIRYRFDVLTSSWYWAVRANRHLLDSLPKPDVVLASYEPPSALWIGSYLSQLYHVPWIADFRDPGALRHSSHSRLGNEVDSSAERFAMRSAAGVTTAGEMWSEMTAAAYNLPAETVYNGYRWRGSEVDITQGVDLAVGSHGYLYYAGTVYKHQLPAFRMVLDALASLPDVRLRLRLIGVPEAIQTITQWVQEPALREQVDLLDRCPATIALAEANAALCNVVLGQLSDAASWTRGHLTGKFLELVALNPPVMVVADHETEFSRVLSNTGKGDVCSTMAEVEQFLRLTASGTKYRGQSAAIESYAKRSQCQKLCAFLDRFVGAH